MVEMRNFDEWNGLADLLGNLIAKYAGVLEDDIGILSKTDTGLLRLQNMYKQYVRLSKDKSKYKQVEWMLVA